MEDIPMRSRHKLLALALSLALLLSLAVPVCAAETTTSTTKDLTGHIVILHTNDVHGGIAGYAKLAAVKESYTASGAYTLLVDAGDYIQGDPTVSASQGKTAIELMNSTGYDAATVGNHEFDYGYANLKTISAQANFPILAANVQYNGATAFDSHTIFTAANGKKIGVFGLETPETATKAHPAKIQGVTFVGGQDMMKLAQTEVDTLKAAGCDYVICLGHLGIDAESTGNRSIDVLNAVTGIDVFIDGHSHSTLDQIKAATNGTGKVGNAYLTSTGTKLANVGVVDIAPDGTITTSNVPLDTLTAENADTAAVIRRIQQQIDADYGAVFAQSEVQLNGEKAQVRTGETNLGDLITDAMLWQAGTLGEKVDAAVNNGGGIRASLSVGGLTKKDINTVLPFGNTLYLVKLTGAQLLEALEASTCSLPESIGAFPQVSGIEYTVNTGAKFSSTENYPGSTYGKPNAVNRVTIQSVGGAAFDPAETYTIVTNDFLGAGGDTYYTFKSSPVGYDTGVPLDEVLMDYITAQCKGTITKAAYGQTAGRIHMISYDDVKAGDAGANDIIGVTLAGWMNGTGTGFSPNASLDRAMMVTILYRLAGSPAVSGTMPFTDVPAGSWYYDAVLWASQKDITLGTSAATFSPNALLTPDQLGTLLQRFTGKEAQGLPTGQTNVTRAQAAAVLLASVTK
jgi:5'-nucleotidase/UDP-sugar diphosphatase